LLSTLTPNGAGADFVQYHHPDRLGTRLVTNAQDTTYFEQVSLPFGTALNAESTGSTNKRFTSYDRSQTSGLDYAINRHYDSQQGRFTQVDPIGMRSTSLENPQTLNLYAYCTNDPINHSDPSGLGFFSFLKKIFKGILKVLQNKWVQIAIAVAILVIAHYYPGSIFGFGGGASTSAARVATAPVLHTAAAASASSTLATGTLGLGAGLAAAGGALATEGAVLSLSLAADLVSLGLATALGAGLVSQGWHAGRGSTKSPCTKQFTDFFGNLSLYRDVASSLKTSAEFVMAHSSWESGWLGQHAKDLHNLFGLTKAGGRNLRFGSYREGADLYVKILQPHVSGAQTIDEFISGLQKAGYNANKAYYDKIKNQLGDLRRHAADCGVTP
jgi:RHS repeat-associated protein